jgi:hypothetical protein
VHKCVAGGFLLGYEWLWKRAITPHKWKDNTMTPAFDHYAKISDRDFVKGLFAILTGDCANDYHVDALSVIPEGTTIQIDFGGNFGCYAMADIEGVIHRVKIGITDIHKIKFL